jgi:hypothetical protein
MVRKTNNKETSAEAKPISEAQQIDSQQEIGAVAISARELLNLQAKEARRKAEDACRLDEQHRVATEVSKLVDAEYLQQAMNVVAKTKELVEDLKNQGVFITLARKDATPEEIRDVIEQKRTDLQDQLRPYLRKLLDECGFENAESLVSREQTYEVFRTHYNHWVRQNVLAGVGLAREILVRFKSVSLSIGRPLITKSTGESQAIEEGINECGDVIGGKRVAAEGPAKILQSMLNAVDVISRAVATIAALKKPGDNTNTVEPPAIRARISKAGDVAELGYRSSPEARMLRLYQQVAHSEERGEELPNDAARTAKQLQSQSVDENLALLEKFQLRLERYDAVVASLRRFLGQQFEAKELVQEAASLPESSLKISEPPPQSDVREEETTIESVSSEELAREEVLLGLLNLGLDIDDSRLIDACTKDVDLGTVNFNLCLISGCKNWEAVAQFGRVNPDIFTGKLTCSLPSFLKDVERTLELTAQLEEYQVFDEKKYPENFAYPETLARTRAVASTLLAMSTEIRERLEAASQPESSSEEADIGVFPPQELALIERLRQYTRYPYIAYAIVRLTLGHGAQEAAPRGMRDRRLKGAFSCEADLSVVRKCEDELVAAGILGRSGRKTDPVLKVSKLKDVANEDVRSLIVQLTDFENFSKDMLPKLPFE